MVKSKIMFIDTHAHLTFPEYKMDLNDVIERAKAAKVEAIINITLDEEAIKSSFAMAEDHPDYIFNAIGLHPHDASEWKDDHYEILKSYAKKGRVVAIG
ncbi:MAG: TatD family hydrolase, partial [Candidatus Saganbacteria bacterium]|nr:TatD family hydrolase [Candidatus Saganbacteria bacterium]